MVFIPVGSRRHTKTVCLGMTSFKTVLLIPFLLFIISSTQAHSSDTKQPTLIDSDSAACVHQKISDICTYSGNAKFNQGTTNLQAQRISIYKTGGKINKIVASNKHSSYSTTDDHKQYIIATADSITIDYDKNTMLLEKNGQLTIGQDKYRGPYIAYKFE